MEAAFGLLMVAERLRSFKRYVVLIDHVATRDKELLVQVPTDAD